MSLRTSSLAAAAAVLLLAGNALASVMVPASVDEMTREADVVAKGRVVSTEGRVSPNGMRIYTLVTLQVEEPWKGNPGKTVQVQVPGGSHGGLAQVVQGAPRFSEGEEVVVFLRGRPAEAGAVAPPPMHVVAMAQGKLTVVEDAKRGELAAPQLDGLEFVDPRTHAPVEAPAAAPVAVPELKARVQALVK